MQLPRTTVALAELKEAGLPYIVVLTDPTTGGVTASYAMLGDVQLAEPGALIGFAGQRVIEQTIREKLPEGFQRAEYLLEHGMIDMVVPRGELKEKLALLISYLCSGGEGGRLMDFARSAHPDVQGQLDRLSKLSPAGDRLGLERIRELLERLGRPQDRLPPVFHVAGTNGKGSTVAFLRAALEAAGHTVHAFTSPHLVRFNERIRIAGKPDRGRAAGGASHRVARCQRRDRAELLRGGDRSRVARVRAHAGGRLHPRGRPWRPARRDQRDRAPARSPESPTSRSITSSSSATACRALPLRKPASPSPACR